MSEICEDSKEKSYFFIFYYSVINKSRISLNRRIETLPSSTELEALFSVFVRFKIWTGISRLKNTKVQFIVPFFSSLDWWSHKNTSNVLGGGESSMTFLIVSIKLFSAKWRTRSPAGSCAGLPYFASHRNTICAPQCQQHDLRTLQDLRLQSRSSFTLLCSL